MNTRSLQPFDKIDDPTVDRRPTNKFDSLLEQNGNVSSVQSHRVVSRPFQRPVSNDRFIRIPPAVSDSRQCNFTYDTIARL